VKIHILVRTVILKRSIATALLLGLCPGLVSCGGGVGNESQFSGYVADHWPRWAGGMPADVPPRPGAPGYDEFIAHGGANSDAAKSVTPSEKTAASSKTTPAARPTPVAPTATPQEAAAATAEPDTEQPAEDSSVVKGGLY
jgi:hypothetical protein